jgi:hypothetical protein
MRFRGLILLLVVLAGPSLARQRFNGDCYQGNQTVTTSGIVSTTLVLRSFPTCLVTVFDTGTLNLSTIFADNAGTPKANPFTAASDGAYFFYANNGARVDVQLSGTGIGSPFLTKADVLFSDLGAGGLTSLNGQTGATQTFAAGTAGADFGISSAGNVHTFNIPTASAANRGLLASADWTTFNSKQATITVVAPVTLAGAQISLTLPLTIGQGGHGQITKTAGFDALSPLTTKGDLDVHNGTNNVRLGVGADGLCLVSDSTAGNGLKWGNCIPSPLGTQVGSTNIPGVAFATGANTLSTDPNFRYTSVGSITALEMRPAASQSTNPLLALTASAAAGEFFYKFSTAGSASNNKFTWGYGSFANAGSVRTDEVVCQGYNKGQGTGRDVTTDHSLGACTESYFAPVNDATAQAEWYVQYDSATGTPRRMIAAFAKPATDVTSVNVQTGTFAILTDAAASIGQFDAAGLTLQGAATRFRQNTNNLTALDQRNAAGSAFVNLIQLTSTDTLQIGDANAKGLSLPLGTTTVNPTINITETWNAGGTSFTGLLLNVTDTASAASSKLLDLQTSGGTQFNVGKAGVVTTSFGSWDGAGVTLTVSGERFRVANNDAAALDQRNNANSAYLEIIRLNSIDVVQLAGLAAKGVNILPATGADGSIPTLKLTHTWNAGGQTFTAIQAAITDTASAAGSLLADLQVGGASKFKVDKAGTGTFAQDISIGRNILTSNCSSSGGTCGASPAGAVTIAAGATTVTVATTAVTANSDIQVFEDSSMGARLGVTCNTGIVRTYAVTTKTAAVSFVIAASAAPLTNPACLSYLVVN